MHYLLSLSTGYDKCLLRYQIFTEAAEIILGVLLFIRVSRKYLLIKATTSCLLLRQQGTLKSCSKRGQQMLALQPLPPYHEQSRLLQYQLLEKEGRHPQSSGVYCVPLCPRKLTSALVTRLFMLSWIQSQAKLVFWNNFWVFCQSLTMKA